LEESNQEEGYFVVSELLTEANTWASVEGKEDERIRSEILVQAMVKEAIWIELLSCGVSKLDR
jgi:hypothetical protein